MGDKKERIRSGSDRNFGITFSIFFLIIALLPLIKNLPIRVGPIYLSILFALISVLKPKLFKYLNIFWYRLGNLLNVVISPIILAILFYLIITPMGIFLKLVKKDILNLKLSSQKETYWIKSSRPQTNLTEQF
jgi:hypothetical protein